MFATWATYLGRPDRGSRGLEDRAGKSVTRRSTRSSTPRGAIEARPSKPRLSNEIRWHEGVYPAVALQRGDRGALRSPLHVAVASMNRSYGVPIVRSGAHRDERNAPSARRRATTRRHHGRAAVRCVGTDTGAVRRGGRLH